MPPPDFSDDEQLLAAWIRGRDQAAFRALAEKYSRLVYGAALRKTGRADWAEEITQEVFVVFARRAAGLRGAGGLAGWLHRTAVFTAATRLRAELRRDARMKKLASFSADNDPGLPSGTVSGKDWTALRPVLDDAIAALPPSDRRVILLHYFEERTFAEVAVLEGLNREAAKKRGLRALEKLALLLRRRGVSLPSGALCGGLTAAFSEAAPAALAAKAAAAGMAVTTAAVPLTTYFTASLMTLKTSVIAASLLAVALTAWIVWPHLTRELPHTEALTGSTLQTASTSPTAPASGRTSSSSAESMAASRETAVNPLRSPGAEKTGSSPPRVPASSPPPANGTRFIQTPEQKAFAEIFKNHPSTKAAEARVNVLKAGLAKLLRFKIMYPQELLEERIEKTEEKAGDFAKSETARRVARMESGKLKEELKEAKANEHAFRTEREAWLTEKVRNERQAIIDEIKGTGGVIPPQPESVLADSDAGADPHFQQADALMQGGQYGEALRAFAALAGNSSGNIRDLANWNAMLCAMTDGNSEAAAAASEQLLSSTPSATCFAMAAAAIQQHDWDEAQIWVDQAAESGTPAENAAMGKVFDRLGWMEEGTNRLIPPGE